MSLAFTGMIFHEVLEWSILLKCGWEQQKFVIRGGHLQHALAKKLCQCSHFDGRTGPNGYLEVTERPAAKCSNLKQARLRQKKWRECHFG